MNGQKIKATRRRTTTNVKDEKTRENRFLWFPVYRISCVFPLWRGQSDEMESGTKRRLFRIVTVHNKEEIGKRRGRMSFAKVVYKSMLIVFYVLAASPS